MKGLLTHRSLPKNISLGETFGPSRFPSLVFSRNSVVEVVNLLLNNNIIDRAIVHLGNGLASSLLVTSGEEKTLSNRRVSLSS